MEVVPTSDGDEDDGVIWFRCPQCQGFLPKLNGSESGSESEPEPSPAPVDTPAEESLPWDSPADMMAARDLTGEGAVLSDMADGGADVLTDDDEVDDSPDETDDAPDASGSGEPLHEYAAMLAATDVSEPTPYRPWETYEVGQCIHHQAWEDCGIVVAKEDLPGGRHIIKCYFGEAGVVRLIEKAPR